MKRRSVLKNLTLALGGLVSLPAWANSWTPESIGAQSVVSASDEALLAEIAETIIPETTTPGAKSLQVHQFALRLIRDCYGEEAQATLSQGLVLTEQTAKKLYNQSFMNCNAQQRVEILNRMQQSEDAGAKQFVDGIKRLTIQGYLNSEYVLVNLLDYNMAPGFYHGCVPVKQ